METEKTVNKTVEKKEAREKVKHPRFGEGEILSIKSDTIKVVFGFTIKEFPYPSSINNGTLSYVENSVSQPSDSEAPKRSVNNPWQRHRWTFKEDKTCCRFFIETYVLNHDYCSLNSLAAKISAIHPNLTLLSIKLKIHHIKVICMKYGIKDTAPLRPLGNYSKQCLRAMKEALQEAGITI